MKYLLDTDICIELIRKRDPHLLKRLTDLPAGEVGVSSITVAELEYGASKSRRAEQNREALERFLLPLMIVDFNYEAAVSYGQIRADLERAGTPIGSFDLLIAAHASSLDVTLVTNNIREFTRESRLRVENWAAG